MGQTLSHAQSSSRTVFWRRFRSHFGVSPQACTMLWNKIAESHMINIPAAASPKHLMWALLLMKGYATENQNAAKVAVDEKTFRKWSHTFVLAIARLSKEIVSEQLERHDEKMRLTHSSDKVGDACAFWKNAHLYCWWYRLSNTGTHPIQQKVVLAQVQWSRCAIWAGSLTIWKTHTLGQRAFSSRKIHRRKDFFTRPCLQSRCWRKGDCWQALSQFPVGSYYCCKPGSPIKTVSPNKDGLSTTRECQRETKAMELLRSAIPPWTEEAWYVLLCCCSCGTARA